MTAEMREATTIIIRILTLTGTITITLIEETKITIAVEIILITIITALIITVFWEETTITMGDLEEITRIETITRIITTKIKTIEKNIRREILLKEKPSYLLLLTTTTEIRKPMIYCHEGNYKSEKIAITLTLLTALIKISNIIKNIKIEKSTPLNQALLLVIAPSLLNLTGTREEEIINKKMQTTIIFTNLRRIIDRK